MCDQKQLYDRCYKQFMNRCNIGLISSKLQLREDIVLQHAQQWFGPEIAQESDYNPVVLNEMFIQYLYTRQYNPLSTALQRSALLPDQQYIRIEDLGIKQPYQYDQHAPDIFKHKQILSNIIKNNLPGNQKIRYSKKEQSIYQDSQELTPFVYKDPLYASYMVPDKQKLQQHFVQQYNEKYLITRK